MKNLENSARQNDVDLKKVINYYLIRWKWFALCLVLAIGIAFVYLRYSIPEYSASAKIQISQNEGASEFNILQDIDLLSGGATTEIQDEISLLNSRNNFIETAKKLRLNVKYFVVGNIKDGELYTDRYPFTLSFLAPDSIINTSSYEFFVDLDGETSFGFAEKAEDPIKTYPYGSNITTEIGELIVTPKLENLKDYGGEKIKIQIIPLARIAESYKAKVRIVPENDLSSIVSISLNDPIVKRAKDIINTLIEIYNATAVAEKKAIADKTSKFINDRISEIYNSLSDVDATEESFKSSRGIADLKSQSDVNFTRSASSEQQLQNANIQLNIAESLKNLIDSQQEYDIIPEIGLNDPNISGTASRYNELVAQRNRLLESSNEKNPVIVKLDQQLETLKLGMKSNLNTVTNNLNLQVNSLSKQLSQINSRIYSAPRNERALRDIARRQQTTESLYLYLLQKREEAQITFASAAPKSKIIDLAHSNSPFPVSPKPMVVYLASMILGVLIPFSTIYLGSVLDSKFHNKLDVESLVGSNSVLAEIPKISKKDKKTVAGMDRTVLAESMRILRTNLDYKIKYSKARQNRKNIIFVTSSVPGEGKTFVASNLAMVFANIGKKVLLIGADIRNPKIHNFLVNTPDEDVVSVKKSKIIGLTEFLNNDNLLVKDIVTGLNTESGAIDVIYSGSIPPNPSDLLLSDRIGELFEEVSLDYDYVIVDTAPLLVVSDTLLINEYASQILYVVRAGVTEKKVLEHPLKLEAQGKLKGLSFIVNAVKQSNLGYGGKYGYGYGTTVKKWWSFAS